MRAAAVLLLAVAVLGSRPVRAQATGTLHVEVRAEGRPLPQAEVTAAGRAYLTDPQGRIAIPAAAGELVVTAAARGFAPASVKVEMAAGEERSVVLDLEKHEDVVTVSATRTGARLDDQPTRVEVLQREEIEEKMLMTPGDIVMMLNEMGGLRVQSTSPSLGAASVRIQGMRGRYTRFLSDGLPLFGQQVGGLGLLQIPPMDLAQVEVIKGTASALYGAGAMGGVVDLISRRPTGQPVREFLLNQTTRGGSDGLLFLSGPLRGRWGATLLAGGHYQHANDVDDDGWADLAGYRRAVARPRFFWERGDGTSLFLTAGVTLEERNGGTLPGHLLPATAAPYPESLGTRQFDVGSAAQIVRGGSLFALRLAAARRKHDHRFGEVRERDTHDTLFTELTARHAFGRHTLVAGIAVERDAYTPTDVPRFRFTHTVPGVFLHDDIAVTSWLSLAASARFDHHNVYGGFFSPRLSALLRRGPWSSRVSLGQGFFAPTPLTEETEAAGLSRLRIPRELRAERGRSLSVDLTRAAGIAQYTATFFASRVRSPIEVERSTYELVNLAEPTTNTGVELLATVRPRPFSVTATYTFVRARQQSGGQRLPAPLTPSHSAGMVAMWERESKARVGIEVYYTGRQRLEQNPFRGLSRDYVIVGALVERRFGPVRAFLNAENLTGVRQTRWDPLLRPSRAPDGRWTVDAWAPLDGRVFNGGIRMEF